MSVDQAELKPLLFFVHVPKTAGSTVNSYLAESRAQGRSHCEAFIHDEAILKQEALSCDWLSGHVDLSKAERLLSAATQRPVAYYTCMRQPTKHVISHYNWLIEIFRRGPAFYEAHPPNIKAISERIRNSRTDASSIVANLHAFGDLFLNLQSRIILGHKFNWNAGHLHQRLDRYELVTDSNDIASLVKAMTGSALPVLRHENASQYEFDPSVFDSSVLVEFLRKRNTLDEILYRTICERTANAH